MKKKILLTEKLIICEIVFCGLATVNINIVIEIPIAENSIRYQAVIDINSCFERAHKKRDIWKKIWESGTLNEKKQDCPGKNGTNGYHGIATGYGLNWGVGVRVPVGSRIFFSPHHILYNWAMLTVDEGSETYFEICSQISWLVMNLKDPMIYSCSKDCGLKWPPCYQYLASGGSDHRLFVWDMHTFLLLRITFGRSVIFHWNAILITE
jgi:hypothetical protein